MEHMPGMHMPAPAPAPAQAPAPAPTEAMPDMPGMDMPGMNMGAGATSAQQPYCTNSMTMNMGGYGPVTKVSTHDPIKNVNEVVIWRLHRPDHCWEPI